MLFYTQFCCCFCNEIKTNYLIITEKGKQVLLADSNFLITHTIKCIPIPLHAREVNKDANTPKKLP